MDNHLEESGLQERIANRLQNLQVQDITAVAYELKSGEFLGFDENGCHNSKGQAVVRFSRQFLKQIELLRHKNYVPKTAKIRFIVYWQKENTEREVRIVLPELYFEKK